jgi:hypothetical protein
MSRRSPDRGIEVRDRAVVIARFELGEPTIVVRECESTATDFARCDHAVAGGEAFAASRIAATVGVVGDTR